MDVVLDFETRSECDLRKTGSSVYARHPSTEVLCLAYKIDDNPTQLWKKGDADPGDLLAAVRNGATIHAHNALFERLIWRFVCAEKMWWDTVEPHQWSCSLAAACRLSLPRSLDGAGKALGLPIEKDLEGNKVMLRLCKPKKPSKKDPSIWDNDPKKMERLHQYCITDVDAEHQLIQTIEDLTPGEKRVWQLDQEINLRGIPIDLPAVHQALNVVGKIYASYCEKLSALTRGEVTSPKQVAKLQEWLSARGCKLKDLTKATVRDALEDETLSDEVASVLRVRRDAGKASTSKLKAIRDRCDTDGRVRGGMVYHGASTGRWAGAGIQIQNFPRGTKSDKDLEIVHYLLPLESPRALDLIVDEPMECISSALRSFIKAEDGKTLLVGDYSAIEACVLAWVAGQDDVSEMLRNREDIYKAMATEIYQVSFDEVTKEQRGIGKAAVLGLGYGMGANTFVDACKIFAGVEIKRSFAKHVVNTYRETNANIKSFWRAVGNAALEAVKNPGERFHAGEYVSFFVDGPTLKLQLPSGRCLHYWNPNLCKAEAPWTKGYFIEFISDEPLTKKHLEDLENRGFDIDEADLGGNDVRVRSPKPAPKFPEGWDAYFEEITPKVVDVLQFMGVDSQTRKWTRQRTYPAKLVENLVQAIARDLLAEAMLRLSQQGFSIVMTVHDEIVCEEFVDDDLLREFETTMKQVPTWAKGCPINVECFASERYKK